MKIILINGSSIPLFEQIKNAIKEEIISGNLGESEQLPSVRVLSKELKVSILTVKKAYDELADEGFIEVRQGLGSFVASNNDELKIEQKQRDLESKIYDIINLSKQIKLDKEGLLALISYIYEGGENE